MRPTAPLTLRVRVCSGWRSSQPISAGVNVSATDPERQWSISCVVNPVRSNAQLSHHDNRSSSGRLIILPWPDRPLPRRPIHTLAKLGQLARRRSRLKRLKTKYCLSFMKPFISQILTEKDDERKQIDVIQLDLSPVKHSLLSIV